MSFSGVLAKMFPFISAAAMAGGPIAIAAAAAVGSALGLDKPPAPDKIEDAITAAQVRDPEALFKLQAAEHDFQLQMERLGLDSAVKIEEISAADRASARAREIAVHDVTPAILAYSILFGFFLLLGLLVFHAVPPESREVLSAMTGILGGMALGVKEYFFGSSAGSRRKSETLDKIALSSSSGPTVVSNL